MTALYAVALLLALSLVHTLHVALAYVTDDAHPPQLLCLIGACTASWVIGCAFLSLLAAS